MPECVETFIKTGSFIDVINIQTDLIAALRQDFAQYAGHSIFTPVLCRQVMIPVQFHLP